MSAPPTAVSCPACTFLNEAPHARSCEVCGSALEPPQKMARLAETVDLCDSDDESEAGASKSSGASTSTSASASSGSSAGGSWQDRFLRDGFVILRGAVPASECERFLWAAVEPALARAGIAVRSS